ncbi:MAG: PAS domain-containing sensor histidine kinase, partial [Desulfovibrio sp.]|nr:PAS domain-containing sensor histidine kinase [Desulfovibrio sp.]
MQIFDGLIERMPESFFVYSAEQHEKILYANAAATAMFGCASFEEFTKHVSGSFRGLVYPDDREAVAESILRQINANADKRFRVTYRIQQKDKAIRWLDSYGHREYSDHFGSVYCVFLFDITAKKLAEDAALLVEKRFNEARNTLMVNLAHDILTPVNAILGYTEQARKHAKDSAALQEHLEKVALAGKLLLAFSHDLMELSEYGSEVVHPQMEKNDLIALVENTLDMVRPQFEAKAIDVTVNHGDGDTKVILDAPRFQRALLHVLFNAVKVSPGDGKIAIAIRQMGSPDSASFSFEIVVSEPGCGTASECATGKNGTDIDLTFTKRIMEILGGNATVTGNKDKGFTFTLSLPLKLVDGTFESLPTSKPLHKASGKKRILLVEDIEIT